MEREEEWMVRGRMGRGREEKYGRERHDQVVGGPGDKMLYCLVIFPKKTNKQTKTYAALAVRIWPSHGTDCTYSLYFVQNMKAFANTSLNCGDA